MQYNVLAGHVFPETSCEYELYRRRHLEPRLARCHAAGHIRRTDACGKGSESAVGAGVGIRADDDVSGGNKSLFWDKGVFNAHFSHVIKMGYILFTAEITAHFALFCCFYVLVRDKMIHDHCDLVSVENAVLSELCELLYSYGRGDVVSENEVEVCEYEFSRADGLPSRVSRKDLLSHCHCHFYHSFR